MDGFANDLCLRFSADICDIPRENNRSSNLKQKTLHSQFIPHATKPRNLPLKSNDKQSLCKLPHPNSPNDQHITTNSCDNNEICPFGTLIIFPLLLRIARRTVPPNRSARRTRNGLVGPAQNPDLVLARPTLRSTGDGTHQRPTFQLLFPSRRAEVGTGLRMSWSKVCGSGIKGGGKGTGGYIR